MRKMNNDLISREALKNALNYIYDCAYINSKSKEGIASDIIAEIDQAPSVETNWRFYYDHGYKQAERDLKRPQGKWELHGMIYYCSVCGHDCGESGDNFCGNCGADMRNGDIDG